MIAALTTPSCIGFQVECGTMLKGGLAVLMGFVLFIGSPMLLLSAVFGRRMAYLVVAVSWFAWIMILCVRSAWVAFSSCATSSIPRGPDTGSTAGLGAVGPRSAASAAVPAIIAAACTKSVRRFTGVVLISQHVECFEVFGPGRCHGSVPNPHLSAAETLQDPGRGLADQHRDAA